MLSWWWPPSWITCFPVLPSWIFCLNIFLRGLPTFLSIIFAVGQAACLWQCASMWYLGGLFVVGVGEIDSLIHFLFIHSFIFWINFAAAWPTHCYLLDSEVWRDGIKWYRAEESSNILAFSFFGEGNVCMWLWALPLIFLSYLVNLQYNYFVRGVHFGSCGVGARMLCLLLWRHANQGWTLQLYQCATRLCGWLFLSWLSTTWDIHFFLVAL